MPCITAPYSSMQCHTVQYRNVACDATPYHAISRVRMLATAPKTFNKRLRLRPWYQNTPTYRGRQSRQVETAKKAKEEEKRQKQEEEVRGLSLLFVRRRPLTNLHPVRWRFREKSNERYVRHFGGITSTTQSPHRLPRWILHTW